MSTWLRPMLLSAIALHAIVLFIPLSSENNQQEEEVIPEEQQQVVLTQLPPLDQPAAQPSPQPSPSPRPTPSPSPRPRPSTQAANTPRPSPRATPAPTATPPQVTPDNTSPDTSTGSTNSNSSNSSENSGSVDPFSRDFPIPTTAELGSFLLNESFNTTCIESESCRKSNESAIELDQYFQRSLREKGYTFVAQPSDETPDWTIYQVTRAGVTQYLTLIPNLNGPGTTILISPNPLPPNVGEGDIVTPEELAFFNDLPIPQASFNENPQPGDSVQLDDPARTLGDLSPFYADADGIQPLPEMYDFPVLIAGQDVQQTFEMLQPRFGSEYTVTPDSQTYAGGPLYFIERGGITGYLNLIAAADGSGTVIVFWKTLPAQ